MTIRDHAQGDTAVHDLADWLLARIAEDEPGPFAGVVHGGGEYPAVTFRRRECEAKRRIVGLYDLRYWDDGDPMTGDRYAECYWDVLRILAAPYADRPGYHEEWGGGDGDR